jgi:hypothetical protein
MEEQAAKTIASSNKQVQDIATTKKGNINAAALNAIASKGSVETFPLVRPASTNSYCGVYIYMDELGMLKKLPLNKRVSSIAEACGYHSPPPNFYGDVFIGRVQTKPSMTNVGFKLEEDTDRSSEWIQRAPYENLAWQQAVQDIQTNTKSKNKSDNSKDSNPSSGGGPSFSWTQDDDEIEIRVTFQDTPTLDKSKLRVAFQSRSFSINYNNQDYLSINPLYATIQSGDGCCTWTIDKPNTLVITMEKNDAGAAWPRIDLNDASIKYHGGASTNVTKPSTITPATANDNKNDKVNPTELSSSPSSPSVVQDHRLNNNDTSSSSSSPPTPPLDDGLTAIPFAVALPTSTLQSYDEPNPPKGQAVALMGDNGIIGSIILMGKKSAMIWVGWGQLDISSTSSGTTTAVTTKKNATMFGKGKYNVVAWILVLPSCVHYN